VSVTARCDDDGDRQEPTTRRQAHSHAHTDFMSATCVLQAHAHLEVRDPHFRSPLWVACERQHVGVMEELLRAGADVNTVDEAGVAVLHVALLVSNADAFNLLLRYRPRLEQQDPLGQSALYMASKLGRRMELDALLSAGAKPNVVFPNGNSTPLIIAAKSGHSGCVEALLAAGVKVDWRMDHGTGALHTACSYGNDLCALPLIEKRADVNLSSGPGRPSCIYSTFNKFMPYSKVLR